MNLRTISVIALSNRDFPSFAAKMEEAIRWIEYARFQGAELAVLPELINIYKGDGPGNPEAMTFAEVAFDHWETETAPLREAARRLGLAVVVPVLIRENGGLANVFFLISKEGKTLGRFQKIHPTPYEREDGVVPGKPELIDWEGVPVGGAICFDTNFIDTFASQARLGAKLLIIPSLWNGGPWLDGIASFYGIPLAVSYPAWSKIVDLDGTVLAAGGYRQETLRFGFGAPVYTATLNFDREIFHLNNQADKILEIQRCYQDAVRVTLLHEQAAFSIESRSETLTVDEIIREYQLTRFRDFLDQSA